MRAYVNSSSVRVVSVGHPRLHSFHPEHVANAFTYDSKHTFQHVLTRKDTEKFQVAPLMKKSTKMKRNTSINILEEERHHWSEVERMHDQTEEGPGCAIASKVEKTSWASQLPSKDGAARWKTGTTQKVLHENGTVHRNIQNFDKYPNAKVLRNGGKPKLDKSHTIGDEQPMEGVV